MSGKPEEFGVGMTMTRMTPDGEIVTVRDRRIWARVDMLQDAQRGNLAELEAKRDKIHAQLEQMQAKMAQENQGKSHRIRGAKGHDYKRINHVRDMAGAYDRVIELYRSGAA